jgi:hypothetical protein
MLKKKKASTICKTLQLIFNYSLQTRKFRKSAIVIALFKKGIKSDPSNYRPISLLSCVWKVFERVVFKYIFNFLLDNSLIYKYQSGFMRGHSTVHQHIEIYHNICLSLENREVSVLYFVIYQKPLIKFGTVAYLKN